MARIQYGIDELKIVTVESLDVTTQRDPSAFDYLWKKIRLRVTFTWQPNATASNGVNAAAAPGPNDGIGASFFHLADRLSYPRQKLKLAIGATTVYEAPVGNDANNVPLACDVSGQGPWPKLLNLTRIEGEFMAMGCWEVEFYKRGGQSYLLNNRWNVASTTRAAGFTTRVIEGTATMNAELIGRNNVGNVDDFRPCFFCPVPFAFRREPVRVQVNEIGSVANYQVTDVECANPLGADGGGIGASWFEGECTAGGSTSIKDTKAQINWWGKLWDRMSDQGILEGIEASLMDATANQMGSCWIAVYGPKNCKKSDLLQLGLQIAIDRFVGTGADVVGAFATQGIGKREENGRYVKVQLLFRPNLANFIGQTLDYTKIGDMANYANDVQPSDTSGKPTTHKFPGDVPPIAAATPLIQYGNAHLGRRGDNGAGLVVLVNGQFPDPAYGNRGAWVGSLIVAALQASYPGENSKPIPPLPPAESAANYQTKPQ